MEQFGQSEMSPSYRLKEKQQRFLGKLKWGYYIDIEHDKSMIIPARKLMRSCVNILSGQYCQICMANPVEIKAVTYLEQSSREEWNKKLFFCRKCVKEIKEELEIETHSSTELFVDPVQQLNKGFTRIREQIFKRQLYLTHVLRTRPEIRTQIELLWKESENFYRLYQNLVKKVLLSVDESSEIRQKKVKNFMEVKTTYEKIRDSIHGLLKKIKKDPKISKLAKDHEIMVQRDLQRIIEDQKTEAESEQEENKKMMEEISTKS